MRVPVSTYLVNVSTITIDDAMCDDVRRHDSVLCAVNAHESSRLTGWFSGERERKRRNRTTNDETVG